MSLLGFAIDQAYEFLPLSRVPMVPILFIVEFLDLIIDQLINYLTQKRANPFADLLGSQ